MTLPFDAENILKALMSRGGEYGEIFIEHARSLHIHLEDGKVEKIVPGIDRGVGIRLIRGGKTFYGWTSSLNEKEVVSAAENLATASNGGEKGDVSIPSGEKKSARIDPQIDPETISIEEKLSILTEAHGEAKKSDNIKNVRIVYGDTRRWVTIVNTDGVFVEFDQPYILFAVLVVAEKNGILKRGYETLGGTGGVELLSEHSALKTAGKAAERALIMVEARRAPGGRMPVVISSEAGGTMIHEAVGHGLEADLVQGQLSVYTGKIGEMIASPAVSVVDDPTIPGKRGSYLFDDEGTPAGRTVLVENGVLKRYMSDRLRHMRDGIPLTGNGRRESYRHRPIPRMSNTMITPGTEDPASIIRSVEKGLFVKKMGGGQVNTVTGDFVFEVQEGYVIEKGAVGEPVRGATLVGNGPEVLKMIDMVGNDLGFGMGTCGKDGQGVPVGDAQPSIRIGEPYITVGGEG